MPAIATTRILHVRANTNPSGQRSPWVWPLPKLEGVAPCILARTKGDPQEDIEIGYHGRMSSASLVPVFAVQDGVITFAGTAANGHTLCIDHADGWSTQYSDLSHLLTRPTDRFRRRRKERVRAGDIIGHARRSPLRIRFALSRLADDECVAQDPAASMSAWSMLPWFEDHRAASTLLPDPPRSP